MGQCEKAPAAAVGHNYTGHVTVDGLLDLAEARQTTQAIPPYQSLQDYRAAHGYEALETLRAGGTTPEELIETLLEAGLRGLGGAGFPSGQKWKFVRAGSAPRYLCINADEGEPGTFKDRYYLETKPHQFLEGMLIAAWGVGADACVIYLRDEYPAIRHILLAEIERLENEGLVAPGYIELRRGAGAYICGEESAMIESIEGKRGFPRHRPPYVAQVGLFDRPTLVHNVETVYWMPEIVRNGAEWFASQGKPEHKGIRTYSVSGRVREPGVVLAPAGSTAHELIEMCGGMAEGHELAAICPAAPPAASCPPAWPICRSTSGPSSRTARSSARTPS
jgi:formate dehydrogenase beta subunit